MLLIQSELQSSSQEMNGACRGRRSDSGEKYTLLSQTFILLPHTAPPVVASKEALSFCSVSKRSTVESLVNTFDFDSHFSLCSFSVFI